MHISLKGMVAAMVLTLTACGNVSHDVAKDGSTAGQLVWPAPSDVTPMHKGGTFPDPAAVRAVQADMNKQQIAQLIGYPHFEEGVWGVREWNYVFNFRDADTGQVTVCEYKILFDEHKLARSFYWSPEDCARFVKPPVPPTVTPKPTEQVTTLSADALFRFDRYSRADITDDGRGQLDRLADSLLAEQDRIVHIHVIGYTDRIGSDDYNQTLSQRRADTVAAYLVEKHVPADVIGAEGRGKSDPVVQCPDDSSRNTLIACLAPNRRVVVHVETRGG
ncbi:OmpA family protein [Dyella caseinilytica]|uniref:OmpA family protein n=1 Tax=Dyella caseinilytica TaxID=1849581 RepID=A0ABX7GT04_9GAMM|nr:OmpA family protein [Dyella caseinilytica]QRN53588.1 OmpA family protein [Dyella caseinilytica]GFZ87695.1 OmpA family protein [Dyella caseinilytica]